MHEPEPDKDQTPIRFTVITGLSGAGRSEAAKCFEDLGYFVIDNLPPALIEKMAELISVPGGKVRQVALVVDVRGGEFFPELQKALTDLRQRGIEYRILFLEANDRVLVSRFEGTRRRHPLASDRVIDGIKEERQVMKALRDQADVIIDTSDLNVHELRDKVNSFFTEGTPGAGIAVNVISFGYKHGLPLDADMVFDCRFLPNPHWVDELRPLNGTHRRVRGYVLNAEGTEPFLKKARDLIAEMLPGFVKEGRHYLTIGVGCTGGKHRSVVIAEEITRFLTEKGFAATVAHRDFERE
ncbi:MAG TPA: RNase adapter RapZ [Actinomycetota bacterium]|nr:RNase adapter RapZ [Actinomycetota bacterium]